MAITASNWLISSDVAQEVAFRVDVPEPRRGRWVLSYLPTSMRLTREQAMAGVVLAEMVIAGLLNPGGEFDGEMATLNAGILGVTLTDVMCLLALRGNDPEGEASGSMGSWRRPQGRCDATRRDRHRDGRGATR
ncbi:hypothetical protein [Nocardia sp. NPDC127526]|uniref:hypothetical protein n=1 Tax=Nocardia sp. NPDC127526 TaxID=3345393 RepID=UPI003643E45A